MPASTPNDVPTGKSSFRSGDSIRITNVQRGEGILTVTADYELSSEPEARISLHITSTKGSGWSRTAASQSKTISKGKGSVTLHHPNVTEGLPHVSFYPTKGGSSFGGIYFGTPEEVAESRKYRLNYMLDAKKDSAAVPDDAVSKAAELRRAKPRQYDFAKASLGDVLRFIATDAGISFISLPEDHPANNKLVTFSIKASPFEVLENLCRTNGLVLLLDKDLWMIRPADDQALVGKAYEIPKTAPKADVILQDIRSLLNLPAEKTESKKQGKAESPQVTFKEAENSVYAVATRQQHTWIEAYFKGLGR